MKIRSGLLLPVLFTIPFLLPQNNPTFAGGGPEGVAIVVNGDSWASKTIANEYIAMRNIPAANVVILNNVPNHESINVNQFRETILIPVLGQLQKAGVLNQIDCISYSSDIPVAINISKDIPAGIKLPKVLTKVASINGLTYLFQPTLAKNPNYLNLNMNWYARRPTAVIEGKPIAEEDQKAVEEASKLITEKKWEEATKLFGELSEKYPKNPTLKYNHACGLAQLGKSEEALKALAESVERGFYNLTHLVRDPDLESLRKLDEFKKILTSIKPPRLTTPPSIAFDSQTQWNQVGQKVKTKGQNYFLSTVLAVNSGRGNSVHDSIAYLKRSVQADATHPKGTIYYMKNKNVRSTTRERFFQPAVDELKKLGVNAVIENGTIPQNKDDVLGAMIGTASFNWGKSKSTILPGAICEHLTSLGGIMRENAGQTPYSEYMRYGASGSSGTVTEPYALQAKFPLAFIQVHYAKGCSLAEAFYQSVTGPYQLLIVGDPLCQPFAKRVTVQLEGLKKGEELQGKVTLTPSSTPIPKIETEVAGYFLFINGKIAAATKPGGHFEIDTTKLPDGAFDATVVAISSGAIETQSRLDIPFAINNFDDQLSLISKQISDSSTELTADKTIAVKMIAPGAEKMALFYHSKIIGTVEGAEGTVEVSLKELGEGPVKLRAIAKLKERTVLSKPLSFRILPAKPIVPQQGKEKTFESLMPGLKLATKNSDDVSIAETYKSDWLTKQKLSVGASFTLSGWRKLDKTETYQFQFNSNCLSELLINGNSIWKAEAEKTGTTGWVFLPVSLEAGIYQFEAKGIAGKNSRLAIRFGGDGVKSLSNKNMRSEAKPPKVEEKKVKEKKVEEKKVDKVKKEKS